MASLSPDYLDVLVDVFEEHDQQAQVRRDITSSQLIAAILEEFGEQLDFLGNEPGEYRLRRSGDGAPLDEQLPLGEQLKVGDKVILEEIQAQVPDGASRPSKPIYLQDVASGRSFRLAWQPAIIGRWDPGLSGNDLVAVDLTAFPGGTRVSRRHVKLWEEGGGYYVQALSNNTVSLARADGTRLEVPQRPDRLSINSQELIVLERSGLTLKFLVREP